MRSMDTGQVKSYIELHILILMYSLGGIFSKFAGREKFLSFRFIAFYGAVLLVLFLYAIVWQQILKRVPLITAYANKAVTLIWGLIWGFAVFGETITTWNVVGAMVIVVGVYMVVKADAE